MRPRRGVLANLMLIALTGCDVLSGAHSYRYRVTVEVETPVGLRTGSSIWEVETNAGSGIPDRSLHSRVHGEAVAVELPSGVLFATMRSQVLNSPGDYAAGLVNSHLRREPTPGAVMTRDWAENMRRIARAKPSFELAPDELPLLVRFRDPKDANSLQSVSPKALNATFGNGVRLRRVIVAVTDERSKGNEILDLLPWLATHRGALERCPPETLICEMPAKCSLTEGDFLRRA